MLVLKRDHRKMTPPCGAGQNMFYATTFSYVAFIEADGTERVLYAVDNPLDLTWFCPGTTGAALPNPARQGPFKSPDGSISFIFNASDPDLASGAAADGSDNGPTRNNVTGNLLFRDGTQY